MGPETPLIPEGEMADQAGAPNGRRTIARQADSWRARAVAPTRILFYGIGNPGRQDDGIGPAVIEKLEEGFASPRPSLDANYQLMVEDALAVAGHDLVVFVDATYEEIEDIRVSRVQPDYRLSFSTHSVSAESVIALARELYGGKPTAYMLHVRGYHWELGAALSQGALKNAHRATKLLLSAAADPERLHDACSYTNGGETD
jgi:hydrogenase maturation protease